MEPRRRRQRGALRLEGRQWVLTLRGEPDATGGARPSVRLRVGPRSELRTRQAARAEADRLLANTGAGTRPIGSRVTFGRYAAEYLNRYVEGLVRPQTAVTVRSRLNSHLLPHLRDTWLDDFSTRLVQDLITTLGREGLAPSTVRSNIALLRLMLKRATSEGLACRPIPVGVLLYPRQNRELVAYRCFSPEDVARILEHSQGLPRLLFAVLAYAGLRIGEALGLRWADIDHEQNLLHVRRSATRGELHACKTAASVSAVPMAPDLAIGLAGYLAAHDDGTLVGELIFRHRNGRPWEADYIRQYTLHPLLKALGIPRAGFHAFRHGLATRLFAAGVGAPTVQAILRHSTLRQTMVYAHTNQDLKQQGVRIAGELIPSAKARVCGDAIISGPASTGSPAN